MLDIARSFQRTDVRVIAAGSFVLGGAAGALVTRQILTKKYLEIINFEVNEVKDSYAKRYKEGDYATPEGAAAMLLTEHGTLIQREGYGFTVEGGSSTVTIDGVDYKPDADGNVVVNPEFVREVEPVESANIFSDVNFRARQDEAMEIGTVRTEDFPYEISVDEYFTENPHFEKLTVTYWEGDDTLADDRESPVPDGAVDEVIGAANLEKFGLRSGDANIVYVRNEKTSVDYEVIRDKRKYAVIVAGANPDDLEDTPPVRTKRRSDVERDD